VSIISRLSAQQGEILKRIIGTEHTASLEHDLDDTKMYLRNESVRHSIVNLANQSGEKIASDAAFSALIQSHFEGCGLSIACASVLNTVTGDYYNIDFSYRHYKDEQEVDYAILEAVGLITKVDTDFFDVAPHWSITLQYYYLTSLGFHFAKACRLVE
jgi:hypothetical protein